MTINNEKVAPGICHESLQTGHADAAAGLGAKVYLPSVAKSQNAIDKAIRHYPAIAKKYDMPVLMSNCLGLYDKASAEVRCGQIMVAWPGNLTIKMKGFWFSIPTQKKLLK